MKCPNCTAVDLLMSERKGIEIDYCPSCRGVWLDRGELDKFIQQVDQQDEVHVAHRNMSDVAPRYEKSDDVERGYKERGNTERGHDARESHEGDRQYHRHGKKKESFWGQLFDFD